MIVTYILFAVITVELCFCFYFLRRANQHLNDASKICEDAVRSLRSGGP